MYDYCQLVGLLMYYYNESLCNNHIISDNDYIAYDTACDVVSDYTAWIENRY